MWKLYSFTGTNFRDEYFTKFNLLYGSQSGFMLASDVVFRLCSVYLQFCFSHDCILVFDFDTSVTAQGADGVQYTFPAISSARCITNVATPRLNRTGNMRGCDRPEQ